MESNITIRQRFETMPAIIRHHVNFVVTDDALMRPGELTTAEAAALAGYTTERIRQLVKQKRIGRWEPRLRMYVVDRAKLTSHIAGRRNTTRSGLSGIGSSSS
jgi:hypothetical protein